MEGKTEKPTLLPVQEWLHLFQERSPLLISALETIYGIAQNDSKEAELRSKILDRRIAEYVQALNHFAKEFPNLHDKEVALGMALLSLHL